MIMSFTKYTTQELEFITNNIELLKKELKKRQIEELNNFPFKVGDVIHTKIIDNYLIKIKEISKRDNAIITDEIIIREDSGEFDCYVDEWLDINDTEWHEYTKIKDSKIFENLFKIINKYNDDIKQLENDTYLKLKNKIETLW